MAPKNKKNETQSSGFSISEYPDIKEVMQQLNSLINQPIRSLRRDALDNYIDNYYEKKCTKSKKMIDEAKEVIPGGVQHNLAFNFPFPLVFTKANGCKLYDLDGNTYYDFLQAGGPTVLGSNPPAVLNEVIKLLKTCGPSTGLFHEFELKLAEFISSHIPTVQMFRMLGSGTEGCMASIRVARLATKKKHVLKMGGAYHGWSDMLAYGLRIPGTRHFESHGIPKYVFKKTNEFYPNDLESLDRLLFRNKFSGGTAAVMIEPLGPESGTRPVDKDFNAGVRKLCDKYGALMIFDEVVTAFRVGLSGAQGYFGVEPDLTVFGKVVAGGYPSAGGLGGKKEYMQYMAAGLQAGMKKALVGGTMAANPLSSAAGYFTLKEMERTNACEKAGAMGDRLTQGLQKMIAKYNLPFVAFNQGSICHLETVGTMLFDINFSRFWEIASKMKEIKARKEVMEEMGAAYMAEGIVTLAGSRMYTSAAYTEKDIDESLKRFERVFRNIEGVKVK